MISIGDFVVRNDKLLVVVAAVVMMVALDQFVNRTKLGRGIRATAQDPETAVLMGVNIDRIVTATFAIGGAMAGVAAALYLMRFEETNYFVGFLLGIKAFTAAVLGGIGNLRGALVGGLAARPDRDVRICTLRIGVAARGRLRRLGLGAHVPPDRHPR